MSRLLVEGRARLPWSLPFADVIAAVPQPTIVQPQPAAGTVSGPAPNSTGPMLIYNPDSVDHTFRAYLRGPGAPAGSVQITSPGVPTPITVASGDSRSFFFPEGGPNLLHDQLRIEYEMQEAVVMPGAFPVLSAFYEVLLAQLLSVKGRRFGSQIGLVTLGTPSILTCPANVRSRTVVNVAPDAVVPEGLSVGSFFRNRDNQPGAPPPTADKTLSFVLTDPLLGSLLLLSQSVAPDDTARMVGIDLLPGQTLIASVAEPTITNDPLMYWVFVDNV